MEPTSPSFQKRPWSLRAKVLTWLTVAGLIFVVLLCIGLSTHGPAHIARLAFFALLYSVIWTLVLAAVAMFVRRLCCWRNFRRALFVLACLVTLIALAWAEENWRGKHDWQKYCREWEAKGEKFDFAAFVPPPVPDEKNFALAPLFLPLFDYSPGPTNVIWHDTNGLARLDRISAFLPSGRDQNADLPTGSLEKGTFADVKACAAFYRGNTNYPQASASATPAETILIALGKFDPELKELREAAASRPACRFPIHYDEQPSWAVLLPHLGRLRGLSMLTHVRATAELEAGRPAEAFEDLRLGFRLADGITNEPIVIDHLVRVSWLSIDLQIVREGLLRHAWTEMQLTEMENYLSTLDLLAEYKFAMRGERAFGIAGLDYLRRRGIGADSMGYMDDQGRARNAGNWLNLLSGWCYQNMLNISRLHQDYTLAAVDAQAHRVFPGISQNGERAVEKMRWGPYTLLARMLFPALQKTVVKSARLRTYVDSARVACALERFRLANGRLPDTLDALVPRFLAAVPNDVIDGKPLRYRPGAKGGYVLYSIGWNQTDDGGQIGWTKNGKAKRVDATQGDWVWMMAP